MSITLTRLIRGVKDFARIVEAIEDLQEKFHATRGHTHAGTVDEGPTISTGISYSTTVVAEAITSTEAAGSASNASRGDHRHAMPGFGSPTTQLLSDTAADGTATTVSHSDHVHGLPGFGSPSTQAIGDAAVDGTAQTVNHSDHKHAMPSSITLANMATIANSTILGNNSGGASVPIALTVAQTKTLLAIAAGDVSGLGTLATTYAASTLSLGTTPATVGVLRLPNNQAITGRNNANNADVTILKLNTSDEAEIPGAARIGGALQLVSDLAIAGNVGFYNTAAGAKPTVTGAKGSNAALGSLLTGLAGLGLITDSSTA